MSKYKEYIGKEVEVIMDRPLGTKHPKHGFEYEVNYGYIPDVIAPDGDELDAYVLGVKNQPLNKFSGEVIAIVHRLDDDDDKLVVVPKGTELTNEEILKQTNFQEQFFEPTIIR